MWGLLNLFGAFLMVVGCLAEVNVVVDAPIGTISGFQLTTSRDGRAYLAWTKIPYAKPPVGSLRFAAPEPHEGWEGILNATTTPPCCHQLLIPIIKSMVVSEDCLYLNVYRPKIDQKLLPVLLYFHGGNFMIGIGGALAYADYIMDEDVVLVTVNYRLSAFGFMALNHTAFPGNFGLKDQALAVKWTKENIESFGGNPDSLTVFGESAGGASSHFLLMSPLTKDLVSRSVSMSGVMSRVWSLYTSEQALPINRMIADGLGCSQKDPAEVADCLRKIDADVISNFVWSKSDLLHLNHLGPVIEPEGPGAFASTDLTEEESTKPMITSYAAGEHIMSEIFDMMTGENLKNIANDKDGPAKKFLTGILLEEEKLTAAVEKVKAAYFSGSDVKTLIHNKAMIMEDLLFVYPAISLAETHKGPIWVYHLEHRGELSLLDLMNVKRKEPCHADEILILFNWRSRFPRAKRIQRQMDIRKSKELIKYIVNFAYYDNPTPEGSGLPTWEPYKGKEILRFKTGDNEMADSNFVEEQKKIRNLWGDILGEKTTKT